MPTLRPRKNQSVANSAYSADSGSVAACSIPKKKKKKKEKKTHTSAAKSTAARGNVSTNKQNVIPIYIMSM